MLLAEYAIDPQALSTWETFRYVADQCGVSKGRLISNFPDNWCREVLKSTDQCRPVARARIVEKLKQLKNSALVNLYRDFDLQKNWQTNALSSHEQMEFRAIIAKNPQDALILDVDLLDESVDAWRVERERAVRRNSGELSAAASYLLMMAQEVMFVDPYFSAEDRRCRKPIIAFLNNMLFPVRRLECHLSSRTSGSAEHFKDVLERFIIPDLRRISEWPSEQPFFFIRWNQRQSGDGEAFHPRYILTDNPNTNR